MNQMPPQVDLAGLEAALGDGKPLLDVREADEFAAVRVPQAQLVPLSEVPNNLDLLQNMAASGPLYVICASGGRSNRAAAFLRNHGIDAINVSGGTNAWHQSGLATETGDPGETDRGRA
jgi:rhodanese-related sulfurtransferase